MAFGNDRTQGFSNNAETVTTRLVIVGPNQGIFVYNGSESFQKLIETDGIESSGIDGSGNAYLAGQTTYSNVGTVWFASNNEGGAFGFYVSMAGAAGPYVLVANIGFQFVGTTGHVSIQSTDGVGVELNGQNLVIPQGISGSIQTLPHDNNSGSTWVSGERAFMNSSWIDPINANFAAIQNLLIDSGVGV